MKMFRTLLVLLWRHFVSRTRKLNLLVTLLEFGVPLVMLLFAYSLRNSVLSNRPAEVTGNITLRMTDPMLIDRMRAPQRIIFGPDTSPTRTIMSAVAQKLRLRVDDSPPAPRSRGVYAYKDELEATIFSINMTHDDALVIFHNTNSDTMPSKLNYTIRMKENYQTHLTNAQDDAERSMIHAPHEYFGVIYEPFMHLQWAIDSSFIESLSGSPIEQTVKLQEFPFGETEGAGSDSTLAVVIMTLLIYLSLSLMFNKMVFRLIEERVMGMRVLVQNVGVSPTLLGIAHYINVLPGGIILTIAGPILLSASNTPILYRADWALLALSLFMYFSAIVAFAFVCSFLTNSMRAANNVGDLASLSSLVLAVLAQMLKPRTLVALSGLLPHVPLVWLWKSFFESQRDPKLDIFKRYQANSESVMVSLLMLAAQIVIFSLLSAYLYRVKPGEFGIAEPWDFMFQPEFWGKKKACKKQVSILEDDDEEQPDQRFFEPASKRLEVGIKIVNVSKIFGTNTALSNVNLEVYKGEITVLLGHNGAGKTTLMNIITGMFSPTEGSVYVSGGGVGLCPQHNIFWKDMSVLHHVMFFTLIKGGTWTKARESSLKLLKDLNLDGKVNVSPADLSGGMKRRLQLACALAGDCSVLALDEPTSGLDVETRRELWDLLLKLRGSRTVLLSTHFMEEADALGDRAAALRSGRIRCHATPMFLKRAIGSGYRLTLLSEGPPKEDEITSLVTKHIPAKITERSLNTLVYNIPADNTKNLPSMFRELEQHRGELGIENIGIGASTLEDVFLKLCSDTDTSMLQDEVDSAMAVAKRPRHRGIALTWRRIQALFLRQFKYTKANLLSTFIRNILIPFLLIALINHYSNNLGDEVTTVNPSRRMSIDSYTHEWQIPYSVGGAMDASLFRANDARFWRSDDVLGDITSKTLKGTSKYEDFLIGLEMNDTDAKAFYTTGVRHAAPAALNFLSNVLAKRHLPAAHGNTITTYNHPLEGVFVTYKAQAITQAKQFTNIITILPLTMLLIHLSCIDAMGLTSQEKESGARTVHYTTGVPRTLYWTCTLLYHMTVYIVTAVPLTMIFVIALDRDSTFNGGFIGAFFVILVLNGLAVFSLSYVLVLLLPPRLAVILLVVCIITFGMMSSPAVVMKIIEGLAGIQVSSVSGLEFFLALGELNPHMQSSVAALLSGTAARLNALCELNRHHCPALNVVEPGFDLEACCGSQGEIIKYWSFHALSPLPSMLKLLAMFVVQMMLVFFLESATFSRLLENVKSIGYKPQLKKYNDANAEAEKAYVEKIMPLVRKHAVVEDEMLLSGLRKRHAPLCGRKVHAVNGVSFSVKKGECLGLLGVNGAGKSSTFRMVTAEDHPTRGDIYCGGKFLSSERDEYVSRLGYCPQFGGADGFLTGRDNVALQLTLRGYQQCDVDKISAAWIEVMGLQRHADRQASRYSGGCARRLACAIALCGETSVALLDEPSAGVDPAARRRLWAALPKGRSLVVTSHSMEEMEALSDRLAILTAGEVCAFGPPSSIRAAYATGHALFLKLAAEAYDQPAEVDRLKADILQRYDSQLKDEHATMLNFHINETLAYSALFEQMEALKEEFSIIEDYGVSETTLEEVFIAFAKGGKEKKDTVR